MTRLSDGDREAIAQAMAEVSRGERTEIRDQLARLYEVHPSTISRAAKLDGTPRKRQPTHPEYREWVPILVAIQYRPWRQKGRIQSLKRPLPLRQAVRIAVASGELPPEAADMPMSTAYRLIDEMELKPATDPTQRIEADYPMEALLIDYSTSEHLVVDRRDGDDWILTLHDKPWGPDGYKNKPVKAHRKRLGVYALWDACTGYVIARYTVAKGENALDAMAFLSWALGTEKDSRLVLHGVPDDLWSDQGPLAKSRIAANWFDRLGIALITGEPYKKTRMGGVEQSHRRRWDFEQTLFYRDRETIRLSELNAHLIEFTVEENDRGRSRTEVGGFNPSRAEAWVALTNGRPADNPLRRLPDNAIATLAREGIRRVDGSGIISWDGVKYECTGWHGRRVIVRQAVDGSGDLTVEDPRSKERRTVHPYERRPYGSVRQHPKSEFQQLMDQHADRKITADIYGPKEGTTDTNVTPIRARSAPAADLENPLAGGDHCKDLDEAMRLFTETYQRPLRPDHRQMVIELIEESGLSRQAVAELAQEMKALALRKA